MKDGDPDLTPTEDVKTLGFETEGGNRSNYVSEFLAKNI